MKKEYTLQELANVLGCSRTAIVKKIKPDPTNPSVKRYKNTFEVVLINGKQCIRLDDEDIEREKYLSRGANNVSQNSYNAPKEEDIIDIEQYQEKNNYNEYVEFTKGYIERFETFQKEMYQQLQQRDNQIMLLTTSENSKQDEFLRVKSENKVIRHRYNILKVICAVLITLFLMFITFFITFNITSHNLNNHKIETLQEK